MIRNILFVLLFLFIFSVKTVQAESLLEVYKLAQENDPEVLSKIYQGEAQSENDYQVLALFFPQAKFRIARTETNQDIISAENQVYEDGETRYPTTEYELTVRQSIYNQSYWEKLWQAEAEEKKIAAGLEVIKQDLILKVIERYFAILNIREEYKSFVEEVKGLGEQYELVKIKLDSGLEKKMMLKKARAVYLDAKTRKEEAYYKFDDAKFALQEITGMEIKVANELTTNFPLVSPEPSSEDAWIAKAVLYNPEIIGQKEGWEVASQEVDVQQAGHYPTVDFVFTHGRKKAEGGLFGGGSDIEDTKMLFELNVPIFEGGKVMSKVRQAKSLEKKEKSNVTQITRKITRETKKAFNTVKISLSKIHSYKELQDASEEEVTFLEGLFKSGVISVFETVDAKRALAKVKADYINSRYEYVLSMMRLKRATGILSEKDLNDLSSFFLDKGIQLALPES